MDLIAGADQINFFRGKITSLRNDIQVKELDIENVKQVISRPPVAGYYYDLVGKIGHKVRIELEDATAHIAQVERQIAELTSSLDVLLKRDFENICPVCFLDYDAGHKCVYLPCCKSGICNTCVHGIIRALGIFKCPNCRAFSWELIAQEVKSLATSVTRANVPLLQNLSCELTNLLVRLTGKTLVVYEYNNVYGMATDIQSSCASAGCSVTLLQGNATSIATKLSIFKASTGGILLMNAHFFWAGFNLEFVNNLVILTKLQNFDQIIGRVDRIGREHDVNIYTFSPA